MILNPDESLSEDKIYKCNKIIARYLIYDKGFPVLWTNGKRYYFSITDNLKDALCNMPIFLDIVKFLP